MNSDTTERCGEILDLLSLGLARNLTTSDQVRVDRHLESCASCADDFRFMARLYAVRPAAPATLEGDVLRRLRSESMPVIGGWWSASVAAAAVLVLAMGMGLATQVVDTGSESRGWDLAVEDEPLGWDGEEWFVAGAPYLEGVSDATLLALMSDEDFQ